MLAGCQMAVSEHFHFPGKSSQPQRSKRISSVTFNSAMPQAAQPLRRGFSLLELVMVLTIIAILAAIATPRYANAMARYRADLAARRIAADLLLAQRLARTESRSRSEEHTSELQSREELVCRLLLEKIQCYDVNTG